MGQGRRGKRHLTNDKGPPDRHMLYGVKNSVMFNNALCFIYVFLCIFKTDATMHMHRFPVVAAGGKAGFSSVIHKAWGVIR